MKLPNSNFCWQKKGYRENRKSFHERIYRFFSYLTAYKRSKSGSCESQRTPT